MARMNVTVSSFGKTVHRVKTTRAREEFGTMVNLAAYGGHWIVFERRNQDLAALIPMDDLRRLEALDAQRGAQPGWDGIQSASRTYDWGAAERVRRDLEVDDMH
ncbi:MAG: hypothetical protein ACHQZQ_07010 [SAR324 cluster bacterium]